MIFASAYKGVSHINLILDGQKTQTRRWSEKIPIEDLYDRYKVNKLYAIQSGRGKKGLPNFKIRIVRKWIETLPISVLDALAEGRYTPDEYEKEFKRLNPKWDGKFRIVIEFEVVKLEEE